VVVIFSGSRGQTIPSFKPSLLRIALFGGEMMAHLASINIDSLVNVEHPSFVDSLLVI
jgi:hypothetical protein